MTNEEKIMKFRQVLGETGDLKTNYWDYMTTGGGYV